MTADSPPRTTTVPKTLQPLLLGTLVSITLLLVWRMVRKDGSARISISRERTTRPQGSLLEFAIRTVAVGAARIAVARIVDHMASRAPPVLAEPRYP